MNRAAFNAIMQIAQAMKLMDHPTSIAINLILDTVDNYSADHGVCTEVAIEEMKELDYITLGFYAYC